MHLGKNTPSGYIPHMECQNDYGNIVLQDLVIRRKALILQHMFPTPRLLSRCIKGVGCGMPRFILKAGRMPNPFGWIQTASSGRYIRYIVLYIYIYRYIEVQNHPRTDTHRFKFAKYQRV